MHSLKVFGGSRGPGKKRALQLDIQAILKVDVHSRVILSACALLFPWLDADAAPATNSNNWIEKSSFQNDGDPGLTVLGNNGGPTQTYGFGGANTALKNKIATGSDNCGTSGTSGAVDQRATVRPQDGTCDIGAFERVPHTPVATDDTLSTVHNQAVTDSTLLTNDTDADGDTLAITSHTQGSSGTVSQSGNSITYTPPAGFSGTDTFTYTVSDGWDGTSTATVTVTVTAQAPDAPTGLSASTGDSQATISFTAGLNGGSSITNYEYSIDSVNWTALSPADAASPVTITGLVNGALYSIRLRAVNAVGAGQASAAVGATPATVPAAPTGLSATPSDSQAMIVFTPGNDGGSAITNYEYTIDTGSNWTAFSPADTTSPVTITGLTNDIGYSIQLRAINGQGTGPASAAVTVTPTLCGPGIPLVISPTALWQQLALPCAPNATPADVAGVLGTNTTGNLDAATYDAQWVLYQRDVAGDAYTKLGNGDIVASGTGYWLKSLDAPLGGGNLTVTGSATVTDVTQAQGCAVAAGCKAVPVSTVSGIRSYNLVGNPFPYHVDWSKVRIRVGGSGGSVYTPSQAAGLSGSGDASPPVLDKQIWIWNGTNYDTWDDSTSPGNLKYFQSFWVKVLPGAYGQTVELLIPAETSTHSQIQPAIGPLLASRRLPWYLGWLDWIIAPAQAADGEWQIKLKVDNKVTAWKDHSNLLGQKLTAKPRADAHDLSEMPPFATPYLSLVFPHPNWGAKAGDYATDFRPGQGLKPTNWTFELRGSPTGQKLVLSWEGDAAILKRSRLVDLQTGKTIKPATRTYVQKGYTLILKRPVQRYIWRYLGGN
jgi:hypothetical protein